MIYVKIHTLQTKSIIFVIICSFTLNFVSGNLGGGVGSVILLSDVLGVGRVFDGIGAISGGGVCIAYIGYTRPLH